MRPLSKLGPEKIRNPNSTGSAMTGNVVTVTGFLHKKQAGVIWHEMTKSITQTYMGRGEAAKV